MAVNETVRDLENNPGSTATVTLDMAKNVPLDNEGDEVYLLTASTTATASGGAAITTIFIRDFKGGFSKSSGFKNAPFTIDGTNNQLSISIDGNTSLPITLTSGTGLSGDDIAKDIQEQIAALAAPAAAAEGNLGYLNATVTFENNRFNILSGSISDTYTGPDKSSVRDTAVSGNDGALDLGFNIPTESEVLSAKKAAEGVLVSDFTASGTDLFLNSVEGMAAGEAFTITDGTNRLYFIADTVTSSGAQITVASGAIGTSFATGSLVQKIFERDASADLASPYTDIDAMYRFALKSIANQIDFTS